MNLALGAQGFSVPMTWAVGPGWYEPGLWPVPQTFRGGVLTILRRSIVPGQAEQKTAQQGQDEKCWHGEAPDCSMCMVRDWFWGVVVRASRIGRGRIEKAATSNSFTGTNSRFGIRGPRSLGR